MIEPININAVLDAVQRKDIKLTADFLIKVTDSRVSSYSVLELMCDYFNSITDVKNNKDAALLCKHVELEKLLKAKNESLTEKYNEAMTDLLQSKENNLNLERQLSNAANDLSELEAKVRELECEIERAKLFQ